MARRGRADVFESVLSHFNGLRGGKFPSTPYASNSPIVAAAPAARNSGLGEAATESLLLKPLQDALRRIAQRDASRGFSGGCRLGDTF